MPGEKPKMKEIENNAHVLPEQGANSSSEAPDRPATQSRRQLIEKYGKYAIVAAPLLLFASKARAIHSAP
jgi:hypothetical protein